MTAAAEPEQLLEHLDPEQRAVATHTGSPLVVLAGAGTGKTRAMTHRIAYGAHTGFLDPRHVLALTFTAKAAGEMRSRLRGLGVAQVQARTFHSAALRQLRYFWPAFAEGPFPELIPQKAGTVGRALAEAGFDVERETIRDIAAEIEYAAVSMLGIDEYLEKAATRELPQGFDPAAIGRVMRAYSDIKTQRRLLDFEDVLLTLSGVLATRPDIAAKVHEQYRHFVVDEFQDVSAVQYDLLGRWLGARNDLCVVGDPAQTIYTFAGASDTYLLGLSQTLPDTRTISLVRNYRSAPPIVATANRVLKHTGRNSLTLVPTRTGGSEPQLTECADDATEAKTVAARIAAQIQAGIKPADIAVLFRTNSQSHLFEEALGERSISFVLRGGERFFARREVKEALALMRASASSRHAGPLPEVVGEILGAIGWSHAAPRRAGAQRERWESLNALVGLAAEMQAGSELPVPLNAFVEELADRQEHQFAPTVDGVTLASIHAAKGLEWPHVHLVGMTEGLLPISYATTAAGISEERRLFYVALTRARDTLSITWSAARRESSTVRRKPSRFIAEMRGQQPSQIAPATGRRTRRKACAQCGSPLVSPIERGRGRCEACSPDIDKQLMDELLAWRSTTAKELNVPVFLVMTTATISAIAERRPRSLAELGQVPGIGPVKITQFGAAVLEILDARG